MRQLHQYLSLLVLLDNLLSWQLVLSLEEQPRCVPGVDESKICHTNQSSFSSSASYSDDGGIDPYLQQLLQRVQAHKFFINGSWVDPKSPSSNRTLIQVIDPSTARPFATVVAGSELDVLAAVTAAKEAYPKWSLETTVQERKAFVKRILKLYQPRREEMAYLLSREMGAPIDMARSSQIGAGTSHLQASLEIVDDFEFIRTLPNIPIDTPKEEIGTTILLDPIGVVAAITPWNWPFNQIVIKIIPALLVGCTVILKPSEITPLSAAIFADVVRQAELPPGVFNMIQGEGPVVGQQLSSHPGVDMVSFTGSTRGGAAVSRAAADTFKKVSLEMGGKGASIVFDDYLGNIEEVADFFAIDFYNSGQSCNYPSRLLVHRSLYKTAIAAAKQAAEQTRVDSAHKRGYDHIGPVANGMQYERIQNYIQSGLDEGATLVAGGLGKPDHLKDDAGFYVKPTVFADCTAKMTIWQEEVFGPFVCITPFDTEAEAIALANDTPYGLTNYVYTKNGPRRRRMAHALKSGMIEMNDAGGDFGSPFGGMKASGRGREGGIYGLEEFCETKAVTGYYDLSEDEDEELAVADEDDVIEDE